MVIILRFYILQCLLASLPIVLKNYLLANVIDNYRFYPVQLSELIQFFY